MANVSSLAFSSKERRYVASCQNSINTYEGTHVPNYFMGPTLYSTAKTQLVGRTAWPIASIHSNYLMKLALATLERTVAPVEKAQGT